MLRTSIFVFSVIITLLFAAPTVLAQSSSPKGAKNSARCEKITTSIQTRITNGQTQITNRTDFATKRKTEVADRIQKLQQKGADVTKLQSDQTQLSTLFDTWV